MSSGAKIIVAPKSPPIVWTFIDYSAGGACLQLFPMVTLPNRFEPLYGTVGKKCRVVWRRGIRIGVAFYFRADSVIKVGFFRVLNLRCRCQKARDQVRTALVDRQ